MLLLLVLLIGCSTTEDLVQTSLRCSGMLEELLAIQERRSTMMDEMQANSLALRRGEMNKEEHLNHFNEWRTQESILQKQAGKLFTTAEAQGCL